jgi:hypothetical protein
VPDTNAVLDHVDQALEPQSDIAGEHLAKSERVKAARRASAVFTAVGAHRPASFSQLYLTLVHRHPFRFTSSLVARRRVGSYARLPSMAGIGGRRNSASMHPPPHLSASINR